MLVCLSDGLLATSKLQGRRSAFGNDKPHLRHGLQPKTMCSIFNQKLPLSLTPCVCNVQGGLEGCAAAKRLEDSLNLEREACEDFLFAVTDDLLTPWQEATCEVFSYPWHLDMLAICNVLAAQHKQSTVRLPAFQAHGSDHPETQANVFSMHCCAKGA